jgi:hypothetical protein
MKSRRNIVVDGNSYTWTLKGNEIYTEGRSIIVTLHGTSYSRLYIDPYDHDFEIKPSCIEMAIKFARGAGWDPENNGGEIRLKYSDGEFEVINSV